MNFTLAQKLAGMMVVINALAGGTAQLVPLFGASITQIIVSIATLTGTIVSGWIFVVTGQQNIVKAVAEMPGVERITVNAQANQALAQVATDPNQPKVGAMNPAIRPALESVAGGNKP